MYTILYNDKTQQKISFDRSLKTIAKASNSDMISSGSVMICPQNIQFDLTCETIVKDLIEGM